MYILIIIIFIFFLGWASFFDNSNVNFRFNRFNMNIFFKINFFLFIASLVGIPPLFGFFIKFIIFLNLIFLKKYLFFLFFLFFNGFLMVFYLNQFRYLQSNFKKNFFFLKRNKINIFILSFIITTQFINVFSIFFIPFFLKFLFW